MHSGYRFSVTIETADRALVYCLRSLAKFSQATGNNQVPWGGTTDKDWRTAGNCVTFRFDSPAYRENFIAEARRLLPNGLWSIVSESDDDPASPRFR
jgi:hypothetical protein